MRRPPPLSTDTDPDLASACASAPCRAALRALAAAFAGRIADPSSLAEARALDVARLRSRSPLRDAGADERDCRRCHAELLDVYVRLYTESDTLTEAQAEAIWEALAFQDGLPPLESEPPPAASVPVRQQRGHKCVTGGQHRRRVTAGKVVSAHG